jgi:cysteinyl-tRNA synthetase
LQAQYRSTLDFSNEALLSSSVGLQKMMTAVKTLNSIKPSDRSTVDISDLEKKCYEAMNDDLNTPVAIAHLFDGVRIINLINDGRESISAEDLGKLTNLFRTFVFDILGLREEESAGNEMLGEVINMLLSIRREAKANKDWATSDRIRDGLVKLGIVVKDRKDGFDWEITR